MKFNRKILSVLILAAFVVQLVIISYNHFKGYHTQNNFLMLIFSIAFAGILSSAMIIVVAYLDILIINFLNKKFPWSGKYTERLLLEFPLTIVIVALPAFAITYFNHQLFPYKHGLNLNLVNNFLISAVINIILISALEAYYYFEIWRITKRRAEELERENLISSLESLKSQLNPHFLFNSLNVLSSLIRKDKEKAEEFVGEFAKIYRYVLESSESTVVPIIEELNFTVSFLNLQKIRFGDGIIYRILNNEFNRSAFLPPLSLQLAAENAIKHNSCEIDNPLNIEIEFFMNSVELRNSYRPKNNPEKSTGIGIINLKKRYSLLSDDEPEFFISNNKYIVRLPLILEE